MTFTFFLWKSRENLKTKTTLRIKYGFFVQGYRDTVFYWYSNFMLKSFYREIIILFRKILSIGFALFLKSTGIMLQVIWFVSSNINCQGFTILMVVNVFLVMTIKIHPFKTSTFNKFETLSLLSIETIIYCGHFFISARNEDGGK